MMSQATARAGRGKDRSWLSCHYCGEKNLLNIVPNRDQFCHGVLGQWLTLILCCFLFCFVLPPRGQSCWESRRKFWPFQLKSLHFMLEKKRGYVQGERPFNVLVGFFLGGGEGKMGVGG